MSQTRSFLLDAGSNYLRMVASILGTVFLTRSMALRWGVDIFGQWSLITTVLGLALLLDFGLSNVVMKAAGGEGSETASEVLSSVLLGFMAISLAAGVGLAVVLHWMLPKGGSAVTAAVLLMSLRGTVATLPWTVFRSTLYARGRMSATNIAQSVNLLVYSAAACWALARGGSMAVVAGIALVAAVADSTVLVVLVRRSFPDLRLRLRYNHGALRPMLSLGGASLLVNLAGFILLKTDPIIVKTFLPFAQVAIYAVALRIAENIFLLCKQLVNALTPHAIRAGSSGQAALMASLFERASRFVLAFGVPLYVGSLVLGRSAIRFWLSKDYEASAGILNILLLAMVLSIPQLVGANLLTFSGRHKKIATFITAGAGINVLASVIFVQVTGASGVAYGTLVTTLIIDVACIIPFACRSFGVSLSRLVLMLGRAIAVPAALEYLLLCVLFAQHPPTSLLGVAVQATAGIAAFGVLFLLLGVSAEERGKIMAAIKVDRRAILGQPLTEAA